MNGSAAACGDRRRHDGGGLGTLQGQQRAVFVRGERDMFGQVGGEVGEIDLLAAGVDDQEQAVFVQAGDHQVVDDAAGLVGEQGVALAAGFQAGDVAWHQAFQRGRDIGSGERCLAHMRHIEQSCVGARMQMFGQNAAAAAGGEIAGRIVLHRHGVAGERHHAGAVTAVPLSRGGSCAGAWGWDRRARRSGPKRSPRQGHPPAGCRWR